ncbi:hypothetical protein [Nocardioides zeae]
MGAAIRSELAKLTSTRLWWVLALAMFAYLAFIGAVMAFSLTVATGDSTTAVAPVGGEEAATTVYGLVNAVGYAFPCSRAACSSRASSGTARSPRRCSSSRAARSCCSPSWS